MRNKYSHIDQRKRDKEERERERKREKKIIAGEVRRRQRHGWG